MRRNLSFWIIVLAILVGLAACRNDDVVLYPDETPTPDGYTNTSSYRGLYVLCEGNMVSNKATRAATRAISILRAIRAR